MQRASTVVAVDDHVTAGEIINIPVEALSADALLGVIDDYVNREGTDYGHRDFDLEQKRDAVRRQLASGRAVDHVRSAHANDDDRRVSCSSSSQRSRRE